MTDAGLPAGGPTAASVGAADVLQILQGNAIVLATAGQFWAIPLGRCDGLDAAVAALALRLLAAEQALAVLQGRLVAVVLTGALPVATLQMGSTDVPVPVPGLLRTDTVSVEVEADVPTGLDLRAMHPARDRDGVLIVQATASLAAVPLATAVPIRLTAFRAP